MSEGTFLYIKKLLFILILLTIITKCFIDSALLNHCQILMRRKEMEMFKKYFYSLYGAYKVGGLHSAIFWNWFIAQPLWRAFTFLTLALDNLFYPGYRKVEVKNPIFIIGHPRSGTTFFHHLFTQTGEMMTFKAWHIFIPALTARKCFDSLIKKKIQANKGEIIPKETGHEIHLDKPEEEEMLFLHNMDTQFVALNTPGFLVNYPIQWDQHDLQPHQQRLKSVLFLKRLFQRQIYFTGKTQVFAQMHFSTHRVKTLLEVFPDAKFVYIARSPAETIPSFLGMLRKFFPYWGLKDISADFWQIYCQNRYLAAINLYRYLYKMHKELPEKILVIPYEQLRTDLMQSCDEVLSFTGIKISEELMCLIKQQAEKQKKYQRPHQGYSLSEFGITLKQIKQDFYPYGWSVDKT